MPGVTEGNKDAALVNKGNKLSGSVAFRILSTINDGVPP